MKSLLKNELVKRAGKAAMPVLKKAAKKDLRLRAAVKAAEWAAERITGKPRRNHRRDLAMRGLMAAAVALPIGLMVGSRMRSGD